ETFACEIPIRRPTSSWVRPRRRTARVISMTRPDLILSCSASGRPKSENTLPELGSTSIPSRTRFVISYLPCQCLCHFEPGANDLHLPLRRGDSALAL